MADDADVAAPNIENTVADGVRKAQQAPNLKPVSACYYCGDAVPSWKVFCCPGCRDDWDWEQARKRANGL